MNAQVLLGALRRHDARDIALIDARTGEALCFGDLTTRIEAAATRLAAAPPGLVLIAAEQSMQAVILLLAAWRAGHAVLAHRPRSPLALTAARRAYRPCWTLSSSALAPDEGQNEPLLEGMLARRESDATVVDPGLALLLSTSGSMSAPRTVPIGWSNLTASLEQIALCLTPQPNDRVLLALPISHIYGLTCLLSHLVVGAVTVLERASVLDPRFGTACAELRVTTLPGVSFMLDTLRATAWRDAPPGTLRKLTHSGDRLGPASVEWALDLQRRAGIGFYRMYGMTETTGRISVLAPEELAARPESVGKVVAGAAVSFDDGEIIFTGPNATSGYAASARDLPKLAFTGAVRTGDLGHQDAQGFLYLTGRCSRIAKLMGVRISLDELEAAFSPTVDIAAVAHDDAIILFATARSEKALRGRLAEVAAAFSAPRSKLRLQVVDQIPRTSTGKILYAELIG